jgi:ribonuclease P protein component
VLKKVNRIKSKKDFAELKNRGVVYHSPFFGLVTLKKNNSLEETKVGIIVSKKISKKAVDRNRIKRLLSISIKNNWDKFKPDNKVLFLAKRAILKKSLEEIDKEMKEIVKKLES